MVSRIQGEVPADTLEAYRRASLSVHELLAQVRQIKTEAMAEGRFVWDLPRHEQIAMVCAWNAFALQSLGNEFLDADFNHDPKTKGFVPPATADQILRYYGQVEGWLSRAYQAQTNPNFRLDIAVPADLPPWISAHPEPEAHRMARVSAMRTIHDQVSDWMEFLGEGPEAAEDQPAYNEIQQLYAASATKARFADDLQDAAKSADMIDRVEPQIEDAIEGFYRLGQVVAMPSLLRKKVVTLTPKPPAEPRSFANPHSSEFDIWLLTAPEIRQQWARDEGANQALRDLWSNLSDPGEVIDLQVDIDEAIARGAVRRAVDQNGRQFGHYFRCPWGPLYEVVQPVFIGGVRMLILQQFVIDVSVDASGIAQAKIMPGSFAPVG